MKTILPLMLLAILAAPPARAAGEEDKAGSGERFLENGGKGAVGDGSGTGVAAGEGGSDRSALDLVNSPESSKGLKTKAPPAPGDEGGKMNKALSAGKGAVIGGAVGLVVGGVAGSLLGPAGTLGGAAGGAKLGAIVGVGVGLFVGYLMGSGKKTETENAISSRQKQLDEAMGQ